MFITREPQIGFFKGAFITNGNQRVPSHFFGSMENVRPSPSHTACPTPPDSILFVQLAQARPFFGLWTLYFLSKITDVSCLLSFVSSTIIQDIKPICDAGQASMAYFYFDFRDIKKQHWRGLRVSLPFSPSFLRALIFVVISYHVFIPIMTIARNSLVMPL